MIPYHTIDECSLCRGSLSIIFKASLPLAGGFSSDSTSPTVVEKIPFTLLVCDTCRLIQTKERISPSVLFKNYNYKTGSIGTLRKHFKELALFCKRFSPKTILEIGCNDGTLLRHFKGLDCTGIDPSDVAIQVEDKTYLLLNNYLENVDLPSKYDLIISCNNFAHMEDLKGNLEKLRLALNDKGYLVIEVHWGSNIFNSNFQFPFLYHEHIYYFTVHSMESILSRYDLYINDVFYIKTHGGSLRFIISKMKKQQTGNLLPKLKKEEESIMPISSFQNRVKKYADKIQDLLKSKRISIYGSSGQAVTFLNITGLSTQISSAYDDSLERIGKFIPGTQIKIKKGDTLDSTDLDYIICTAYTFIDEIKRRHPDVINKWLVPLPDIRII